MPRPWRLAFPGAKYHVTSRGNARQRIFLGDDDRERFVAQLAHAVAQDEVILYAYCLMPNHYHLLMETPRGNIQRFMQRLNTAYSMYFRYKHARPGHCLQGRYGAKIVEGNDYLVRLTRYIHLNPVRGKPWAEKGNGNTAQYLRRYRWSSYRGYVDEEAAEEMIDYRWLRLMERRTERGNRAAYEEYIQGMIACRDDVLAPALKRSRYAVGSEPFIEEVEEALQTARQSTEMKADVWWPSEAQRHLSLSEIDSVVADVFGVSDNVLRCHGRTAGVSKTVAVEMGCRHSGQTQRQLVRHYGYRSDSSVSRQRARLAVLAEKDPGLAQRVRQVEKRLTATLKSKIKV